MNLGELGSLEISLSELPESSLKLTEPHCPPLKPYK